MPDETPQPSRWKRIFRRFIRLLIAAVVIGSLFHFIAREAHRLQPSGFKAGILHGVLMPLALPNLLVGDDVVIYAPENTGRLYKLGYTIGVNGCGLLFFGLFFWRIGRWRRQRPQPSSGEPSSHSGSSAY